MYYACISSTSPIAWTTRSTVPTETSPTSEQEDALRKRVAELEATLTSTAAALTSTTAALASVTEERDKLRRAYEQLKGQLELLRRRIYVAKADRIDTRQLELEFAEVKAQLDKLAKELGDVDPDAETPPGTDANDPRTPRRRKPKGRRDLGAIFMPEERVEITDPTLEGVAERIGFEESYHLGHRRGGPVRIVMARVKYKVSRDDEDATIVTAAKPKEIYERGMLAPSFIAHLLTKKFRFGMPFTRLAEELASEGIPCDD